WTMFKMTTPLPLQVSGSVSNDPIYHNASLRAPPKRAESDSDADTEKRDVFPGVNRKNASGSLSAHCIAMHESEWRSVWGLTAFIPSVFDSFSPGS
ncbi:hypothetical protein, partial [Escherichia coli]|uniref:hypothetical protein n=1 Tax=Escherichia coli TaxID=562 RepID=UPI001A8FDEC4